MIVWNGKSADYDWEEMRITLHWHLAIDLKPLNISKFLYKNCVNTWPLAVQNRETKEKKMNSICSTNFGKNNQI